MAADAEWMEQHWIPDHNGLVQQGLIGEHMVRVTVEPYTAEHLNRTAPPIYRVTIGLFHKYGNTSMNLRHHEWTSRHRFSFPKLAWMYGIRIVNGATNAARND